MQIKHFRGVFMRDELNNKAPWKVEKGIINLDSKDGPGTHWVAYYKNGMLVKYFDSFGDLRPPKEVLNYFKKCLVIYNKIAFQSFKDYSCGHLCLAFLDSNK